MTELKFRENAITSVKRDAVGITILVRDARRLASGELETVSVLAPITVRWAQLSSAVREEALGYGMEVRLTRAAAIGKDTKTGRSANAKEKHEAIRVLAEHYASGAESWTMASLGGGGLSADTRALCEALVRALGMTADAAEDAVREMSSAERDALRCDDEIKPHLDAVYAERARAGGTAGMITKNLLAKLRAGTATE